MIKKRYHLQARAMAGPLWAPTRNETRNHHGDERHPLERIARELTRDGFTVWLHEGNPGDRASEMRCIAVYKPEEPTPPAPLSLVAGDARLRSGHHGTGGNQPTGDG